MKKTLTVLLVLAMLITATPFALTATAETEGYLTYEVSFSGATITRCNKAIGGKFEIPSNFGIYRVTKIGEAAFAGCTGLTEVIIPNSVISISSGAFDGCVGLESIKVKEYNIKYFSSNNCVIERLTNRLILGCQKSIIPNSVREIGDYAFSGCTDLTKIKIPNSVKKIGNYAFFGCTDLTKIEIPNSVNKIGDYAFSGCTDLTEIIIPKSVEEIGVSAFSDCTSLKKIMLSASVATIEWATFKGCVGLESIVVDENNTKYYSSGNCLIKKDTNTLILGCKKSIIPNSVKTIGENAFRGCTGLTEITIPDSVISIKNYAFAECTGLLKTTLSNSLNTIGENAFRGCTRLKEITIPNSVTSINNYAFAECTGLLKTTLSNSLNTIGENAFRGCTVLKEITIPNSVENIGEWAFENCTGLTEIKIPASVKHLGLNPFKGCTGLESIVVDENNANYYSSENCLIEIGRETKTLICGCKNSVIPADIPVIGNYAFYTCADLTEINIPASVTEIGWSAFEGCTGLTKIEIPNSVKIIDCYSFAGCSGLTEITIPDFIKEIGHYAFSDCSGLTKLTISASVKRIGQFAFAGCSGLTEIIIPDSVREIELSAFKGCYGLESIVVNEKNEKYYSSGNCLIKKYSNTLILGCKNSVIPNSVTEIGGDAFTYCKGLTEITIPDSVMKIGKSAFEGCTGLIDVYYTGTEEEWNSKKLYDFGPNVTMHFKCTHKNTEIRNAINSTCTDAGYTGDTYCIDCGEKIADSQIIAALGHKGGTATCSKKAVCSTCGKEYGDLNPTNHVGGTEIKNEKVATCTDAGYTGDTYCIGCGEKLADGQKIAALGHDFATKFTIDVEPKCTEAGSKSRYCSRCDAITNVTAIPATGHKGGTATCSKKAVCSICGKEYGDLNPTNHVGGTEIKNIKEATYEAAGYTGDKVCKSCGVVLEKGKVIPKLEKPTEVPTNKPIDFPTEVKKPDYNKLPVQTEENDKYLGIAKDLTVKQIKETFKDFTVNILDINGNKLEDDGAIGTGAVIEIYDGEKLVEKKVVVFKGDINGDGQVKTTDARNALRAALGLDTLKDVQSLAADVNNDGNLKATDARSILRGAMGLDETDNWLG